MLGLASPVVAPAPAAAARGGLGGALDRRRLPLAGVPASRHADRVSSPSSPAPRSVRVSLTDACDLACTYCRASRADGRLDRPVDGPGWSTLFAALRAAGVRRVRLTGGEPLLHRDVVALVARLADLGFEDIALTTNGTRLARLAAPLRAAGLHRLNLSVDSLRPDRFRALTRGGDLRRVLAGLEAALVAGFAPIKLNTVVLRGFNDDEVEPIVRFAWDRGLVPRFLEVMPIGEGRSHMDRFVPADEVRDRLAHLIDPGPTEAEPGRGPARYVRSREDAALRVGFITGTSHSFCASCDRLRVSSAGVLRPCLATDDGVDAGDLVRSSDVAGIAALVAEAWTRKPDGAVWRGCVEDSASRLSMRAIGG